MGGHGTAPSSREPRGCVAGHHKSVPDPASPAVLSGRGCSGPEYDCRGEQWGWMEGGGDRRREEVGGERWARPGGQSPLIATGATGQGGCGQAALCPARSQPADGGLLPSPLRGLLYAHMSLGVWEPLLLAGFSPPSLQLSRAAGRQGRRGGLWLIPNTTAPLPSQAPSSKTLPRWGLGGSQDPRVNPRPTRASSSAGNPRTETPLSHHSASVLPNMWITCPCRGGLPGEPALMGTQPEGVVGHPRHLLSRQTAHSKDSLPVLAHPADPTAAQPWPQTLREGRSATPDFPGDALSPANLPSCKAASWGGWGDEPSPSHSPALTLQDSP